MPVGKCDKLPGPGTWEDVTPPGTSSKPAVNGTVGAAIIVDPFDPRTVWLGTGGENDEIWRSDDCGATWTQVNTGPGSVGDGKTFGGVGDGAQWSMQADPVDPGVLYAVSGYGAQSLWKTTDGGHSWTDVLAGTEYETHADYRFVNNVSLDPTDHLHLVVSTHGGCSAPYGPSCIAETKDGGSSWRVLSAPEGWVEGGGLILVKGGLWIWCGSSLMVTTDAGESWSNDALAGGGSCEAEYTIRSFVPAANGKYYLGSRAGVLRSTDGAKWEHVPGTSGTMVMIAQGSKQVFAANQWQPSTPVGERSTTTRRGATCPRRRRSARAATAASRSSPTTTRTASSTRRCFRAASREWSCRRRPRPEDMNARSPQIASACVSPDAALRGVSVTVGELVLGRFRAAFRTKVRSPLEPVALVPLHL